MGRCYSGVDIFDTDILSVGRAFSDVTILDTKGKPHVYLYHAVSGFCDDGMVDMECVGLARGSVGGLDALHRALVVY